MLYVGFSALQRAEIAEIHFAASASHRVLRFSALQRAEIAEIAVSLRECGEFDRFSALQRAEIAEIAREVPDAPRRRQSFSALQRAEIAEIQLVACIIQFDCYVSVLFNEPKLLKSSRSAPNCYLLV